MDLKFNYSIQAIIRVPDYRITKLITSMFKSSQINKIENYLSELEEKILKIDKEDKKYQNLAETGMKLVQK